MNISKTFLFRCVVWTGDNRVFFFNPSTKTSLWECPPELKNRPEIEELTKAPPKANDLDNQNQSDNNSAPLKRPIEDEEATNHVETKKSKYEFTFTHSYTCTLNVQF